MKAILMPFNAMYALDVCSNLIEDECRQIEAFTGKQYNIDAALLSTLTFNGPKWSILHNDRAVVVGGCIPHRPGVYQSWFLSTPAAWQPGIGVTGITRRVVVDMLKNGARRVETVCLADRALTRQWYEKVGLRFEATHEQYGVRGETAAVYVATFNHEVAS
jgi:hypothetical protein